MVAYREDKDGQGLPEWYPVLVAKEGDGPEPPELRHYLVEGENRNVEFTNRGRGKILAIGVESQVYYNPNQCARNVFEAYADDDDDSEEERVRTTVNDYFEGMSSDDVRAEAENSDEPGEDDEVVFWPPADEFQAGQKGHCHPPRDDKHCHDSDDSNDQSNSNGQGNGKSRGRGR